MLPGYTGSILKVDLTKGCFKIEKPEEAFYRKYVGGSAMGLHYLLHDCQALSDPLGPDNVLVFAAGPVAGSVVPGNSRLAATAKSPLTGMAGDSQVGGYIAPALKLAGFDAIVIRGCSPRPVYLWVEDGQAELRNAHHLWGLGAKDAEEAICRETKEAKVQMLVIGPAGEKLSRMASIIHRGAHACGRNGLGAVMGSKRLKAVVLKGQGRLSFADPKALKAVAVRGAAQVKTNPVMYDLYLNGSNGSLEAINDLGALPTRNYNEGSFEGAKKITGAVVTDLILKGRESCYGCPVRCKRVVEIKDGPFPLDSRYGGAEYESVAALGAYCGVGNLAAIHLANQYCNHYGLDTISTGATIAFAMECYENGILTKEHTNGLDLCFGNASALVNLVKMIGEREGFGDLLAEGSERAAQVLGVESRRFLITCKSQELPAHMPQWKKSLAIIYAVNPFGADHESSEHDPTYEGEVGSPYRERLSQLGLTNPPECGSLCPEKVRLAVYSQRYFALLDTIPLCHFCFAPWTMYDPVDVATVVEAATGWNISLNELLRVGERRINMMRVFNMREGVTRDADTLPEKLFRPLKGNGFYSGKAIDRNAWLQHIELYYEFCGWEKESGNPSKAKCEELGLEWPYN